MSLTCENTRIGNSADAELVIEAVRLGHLPICKTRLLHCDIRPGDVYVWIEAPDNVATGTSGLARWTDGHKWTTGKWKDDTLIYMEIMDPSTTRSSSVCNALSHTDVSGQPFSQTRSDQLIKQCYSIIYDPTSEQRTHYHLIAYFSVASRPMLQRAQSGHIPCLLDITVPTGHYLSYRKFKANQRRYSDTAQSRSKTPSSGSRADISSTSSSDRLPPLNLIVSLSHSPSMHQPRKSSLGPSLSHPSASRQFAHSNEVRSSHSIGNLSSTNQLLPLTQLHGTHLAHHRSDVDRLHVAALDGYRSSHGQLHSSHTATSSDPSFVPRTQSSASTSCPRCATTAGGPACLQCGQT